MNIIAQQDSALAKGSLVVVKLGGRSVETQEGRAQLARRLATLVQSGVKLVVVHGGGAQVTAALEASGIEVRFVAGLRVTDEDALAVAEPVFTHIGKMLAHALSDAGAPAVGLTGRDGALLTGVVKDPALGRVGTIVHVDDELLRHLAYNGMTPVIGPIAVDDAGPLNVNADEVASAVARALGAKDLLLLTDVPAVRDENGAPIASLTPAAAQRLIAAGVARDGMVPKIAGALAALATGVSRVRVLDEAGLLALAAGQDAGTVFHAE